MAGSGKKSERTKKKENVYICETKGNMNISKIWKVRLNVSNYL